MWQDVHQIRVVCHKISDENPREHMIQQVSIDNHSKLLACLDSHVKTNLKTEDMIHTHLTHTFTPTVPQHIHIHSTHTTTPTLPQHTPSHPHYLNSPLLLGIPSVLTTSDHRGTTRTLKPLYKLLLIHLLVTDPLYIVLYMVLT